MDACCCLPRPQRRPGLQQLWCSGGCVCATQLLQPHTSSCAPWTPTLPRLDRQCPQHACEPARLSTSQASAPLPEEPQALLPLLAWSNEPVGESGPLNPPLMLDAAMLSLLAVLVAPPALPLPLVVVATSRSDARCSAGRVSRRRCAMVGKTGSRRRGWCLLVHDWGRGRVGVGVRWASPWRKAAREAGVRTPPRRSGKRERRAAAGARRVARRRRSDCRPHERCEWVLAFLHRLKALAGGGYVAPRSCGTKRPGHTVAATLAT
jgi:hypothetical protein